MGHSHLRLISVDRNLVLQGNHREQFPGIAVVRLEVILGLIGSGTGLAGIVQVRLETVMAETECRSEILSRSVLPSCRGW